MKRIRLPLVHPLAEMFFAAIQSATTSMSDSTKGRYRTTAEYFLRYLSQHHPDVQALDHLRRDRMCCKSGIEVLVGWCRVQTSASPI